ncbi:tRNA methyltransferase ppm2 [Cladophialophora chaetospira]|uniref:tRNA wybutosine-synthesizing protein 4 n=1 Tax=Cladophialophora chaetospira TaxID=386627 RepID=A0AA39CHB1_9EURO|nr:tRNA methyltransferase ppm2 [Cladophialophora chaetospira]
MSVSIEVSALRSRRFFADGREKTNSSTTALKASTERLYMSKPHFYKAFAKEVKRATPVIHRGYWLRMRAVSWVVRNFLERASGQRKVIINYGCGYDPLPFRWLAQKGDLCTDTKFVDVDYELLIETKRDIIMRQPEMRDLLHSNVSPTVGTDPSIALNSEEYAAIGCDMRNIGRLDKLLKSVVDLDQASVLCIAEDSTTFMPVKGADALIWWSTGLSSDVTFCLVEPSSPDQPDNPFTKKMTDYYKGLGTPLNSIFEYPYDRAQIQRFSNAGYAHIDHQSLWELWADGRFLSPSQRMKLDHVEPFDDWEEFALWASHYCLVVAHNGNQPILPGKIPRPRRDSISSDASDISARTSSPCNPDTEPFAFRHYGDPGDLCRRHHGSAYPVPDQDAIAIFGGKGADSFLSTSAVCRPRHLNDETPVVLSPEVGARSCHVMISLNNGDNFLVGGRRSPSQPLKDCWLQKGNIWYRVHDLPEGRFRHRLVPVTLPGNVFGAICFGGKVSPTKVATEVLLWEPLSGWRVLRIFGSDPKPRFGENFICLGFNHGLLFGGMRQDGLICQGFWRWRLVIRDNKVLALRFRPSHALDTSIGSYQYFARFGASYGFVQDYLLIIGGVARGGCIPRTYEILSLTGTFSTWHDEERREPSFQVLSVDAARPPDCPRPFLIGHSTRPTQTGAYVILGGGATCFNFGDYFNQGIWVLYEKEAGLSADWIVVPSQASKLPSVYSDLAYTGVTKQDGVKVNPISLNGPRDFHNAIRQSRPLLMRGLDYGPCAQLWSTPSFLEGLLVDEFDLEKSSGATSLRGDGDMPLTQLLCEDEISSTIFNLPPPNAKVKTCAPKSRAGEQLQLANQFHIPPELREIESLVTSVQLQISRKTCHQLRYSATGTVFFHQQGVRKILISPPFNQSKLGYAPGSNISDLNILCDPTLMQEHSFYTIPGTSTHIALMQPGDALYIPPFWSRASVVLRSPSGGMSTHSIPGNFIPYSATSDSCRGLSYDSESRTVTGDETPPSSNGTTSDRELSPLDVSIKVSFSTLPQHALSTSAANNWSSELKAYEDGRQDLQKVVQRFTSGLGLSNGVTPASDKQPAASMLLDHIPKDVVKAYLQRLGKELLMKADEL